MQDSSIVELGPSRPDVVSPANADAKSQTGARESNFDYRRGMKYLETSGGRALTVRIEGAPGTVKDYMVAARLYLLSLEEAFETTTRLMACYRAAQKELEAGRSMLTPREIDLTSHWQEAHAFAEQRARPSLSDPQHQRFALAPLVEPPRRRSVGKGLTIYHGPS